ncbi:MAG: imidazole glycerol phosphate synthase subunit HisH [Bacteroidales bacterium]|nr:imidazole glycerol phosphate synthase subunit HisH [Bacteroidales bacterium]
MKVAIIKYNAGNIMSVDFAMQRLGIESYVTDDHDLIRSADRVIFPGVGEAGTTMKYLKNHKLDQLIRDLRQPVLGICLGLQLMCSHSEEGDTECLGIFGEKVKKFIPWKDHNTNFKVPHMGWNNISGLQDGIFSRDLENQFVYFVHSFYAATGEHTVAACDYLVPFSAALRKENFYATQFHPEKSGRVGAQILKNFIEL